MDYKRAVIVLMLLAGPAVAQPQQADPALMQKAIAALQVQRNMAMDAQASAEAQLAQAREEIAKYKAEIEELKKVPAK